MKNQVIHWLLVLCVSSSMLAQSPSPDRSRLQAAEADQPNQPQDDDSGFQATHQQSKILKLLEADQPIQSLAVFQKDAASQEDAGSQEQAGGTKAPAADRKLQKTARQGPWQVKSFCLTGDDQLLVAVGGSQGELRWLSSEGEFLKSWSLPIVPEAVNVDVAGNVLVAGQGHLLKLNSDGKILLDKPSPLVAVIEKNRAALRQQLIADMKASALQMQKQRDLYATRIDAMVEKATVALGEDEQAELKILKRQVASHKDTDLDTLAADDLNAMNLRTILIRILHAKAEKSISELDARRLQMYRRQLVAMNQYIRSNGSGDPSDEMIERSLAGLMARTSQVASISAGDGDIFLATGAIKGYGYDVWRLNDQMEEPESIVTGLRGCCGQMDVQGNVSGIFVAENSRHRVCHFDRDGARINEWGSRQTSGVRGFGGCCNPMNVTFGADGSIYTAESTTGRIKQFSPDGQLLALVGSVELVPGCKKVSIGVNASGDRVYMLDITRNHIVVMSARQASEEASEEAAQDDLALDSSSRSD